MGYIHFEVTSAESAKYLGRPCGDVLRIQRDPAWSTLVLADGIGSGLKANLAATMCVSRLLAMLKNNYSPRECCVRLAGTMNQWRDPARPYACFTLLHLLNDGQATVLSYEMPPPILITPYTAQVLSLRIFTMGQAVLGEAVCRLNVGEGLMLISDGVSQAGMGRGFAEGWTAEGVADYLRGLLSQGTDKPNLARLVHDEALRLHRVRADDISSVLAWARKGTVVNILTGPPADPSRDAEVVQSFMRAEGTKVVCGATTARIVAKHTGRRLDVVQEQTIISPPRYAISGVGLVTEGAVTLNQVYNILGEPPSSYEEESGVTRLCSLLAVADRVNIILGRAANPANDSIVFRQQGILCREKIVPLLAQKLREEDKLVVLEEV
jgi:hypothetical protein